MPAPYALASVRGAGSTRAPGAAAAARASTLHQNLGGGGPVGGALARGRAHAAVFFSHNPEAEAREGGESAEGYRRGGSGALARQAGRGCAAALRFRGRYPSSSRGRRRRLERGGGSGAPGRR